MESFEELSRHFGITGTVQETMCDEFYRQGYLAGQAALAASPVPACRVVDRGFRWVSDAQHHVPQLVIEFEPVPANAPCDAKGWRDRDQLAAMLSAPTMLNGLTESETLATASVAGLSAPAQQASCRYFDDNGEVQTLPGHRWVAVNEAFDDLMRALLRAESRGYMPDAMADEWARFEWFDVATAPSVEAQAVDLASFCDAVFKAAINCGHSISDKRITLNFDKGSPGHNALNQLHRRLYEAVRAAFKESQR